MNILNKLIGRVSPFTKLQDHLEKVMECVRLIEPTIEAALEGNEKKVSELAHEIFRLEHEADEIKNGIRDSMPRELLMPVSRIDFLAFLREQDSLADKAEDMAMMLSIRQLRLPDSCERGPCAHELRHLAQHAVEAAEKVAAMTRRLDEVKAAGFKGPLIEEMREQANAVSMLEYKSDKHQFRLVRSLLTQEGHEWPFADSYAAMQVVQALGKLANHAEGMSDYLRQMLAA